MKVVFYLEGITYDVVIFSIPEGRPEKNHLIK